MKKKKDDLNNSKIKKFFAQTSEEDVEILDDSKKTKLNNSLEKSKLETTQTSGKKLKNFKSLVEENGHLAFKEIKSNLENHMFGEVATVIELYNLITEIFIKNSKKTKKSTKKIRSKDLDLMKIDLNQFVLIFDSNSIDGKNYFIKIIQNILKIFIFYEKLFGVS